MHFNTTAAYLWPCTIDICRTNMGSVLKVSGQTNHCPIYLSSFLSYLKTRKPCYRKVDRTMRPIYGCPEKFRESSQTPPATFPEICKGLLFRSILRMCIQKFVALSVPEIIGATQKIWAVPRYAHTPFSLKFLKGFCSDGPCEYTCQIWSS